ncbi:MULE transposase domain protein [Tautonia plasticadhaerens]|uniref:MULE transposase domain protein n=1 Tax=Tautonia plasticadhaerens TaxID=2527974 RepID=A0A518H9B3_9BACT|nr:MULE transposase domain protein [Tautonia plasticadhaerens]
MPRRSARPKPDRTIELTSCIRDCPECGRKLWAANKPSRTVVTPEGLVRLRLQVRSCRNPACSRHKACLRPEQEGRFALPQQEFGLDVIALAGRLRHGERRSVPEIHAELVRRGVPICERSVGNLVDRYDELLALTCADPNRLRAAVTPQGRAILAIDGLQPDVGHEVLWVIREVLSGEVLLARSLLSSTQDDLAALLVEVEGVLGDVPIAGVVSDGQTSIRRAVAKALPDVPHQLCHFHTVRTQSRTESARRRPLRLVPLSTS